MSIGISIYLIDCRPYITRAKCRKRREKRACRASSAGIRQVVRETKGSAITALSDANGATLGGNAGEININYRGAALDPTRGRIPFGTYDAGEKRRAVYSSRGVAEDREGRAERGGRERDGDLHRENAAPRLTMTYRI